MGAKFEVSYYTSKYKKAYTGKSLIMALYCMFKLKCQGTNYVKLEWR